jgi:hypothetical protein
VQLVILVGLGQLALVDLVILVLQGEQALQVLLVLVDLGILEKLVGLAQPVRVAQPVPQDALVRLALVA